MTDEDRNDMIEAYFEAMDAEDPSLVETDLADDFVYESLSGDLKGYDGLCEYVAEVRSLSNSTHEIVLREHGDAASVTEGTVTGENPDGERVEADFCDVFEFDEDDESIARIAVYLNDG